MRLLLFLYTALALTAFPHTVFAGSIGVPILVPSEEMTAREIMEEQKKILDVDSGEGTEEMLLVDKNGNQERRLVKHYVKKMSNGMRHYLLVFLEPAEIKGTALLAFETSDREQNQWLYLPAQKKMQRISTRCKFQYFMGTDLTFEDLEPENVDNFNYKLIHTENVGRIKCHVIEAIPADKEKKRRSGYARRRLWISCGDLNTLKVDFYDRRNRYFKTMTNEKLLVWRPRKSTVENLDKNHKTIIISGKNQEINKPIDDRVFTKEFILSGEHVR